MTCTEDSDFILPSALRHTSEVNVFVERATTKLDEVSIDEAAARAFGVITYINSLSLNERVGILEKLVKYLRKLKKKLDDIGSEWGVQSYSLSVGFTGVELTLDLKP